MSSTTKIRTRLSVSLYVKTEHRVISSFSKKYSFPNLIWRFGKKLEKESDAEKKNCINFVRFKEFFFGVFLNVSEWYYKSRLNLMPKIGIDSLFDRSLKLTQTFVLFAFIRDNFTGIYLYIVYTRAYCRLLFFFLLFFLFM